MAAPIAEPDQQPAQSAQPMQPVQQAGVLTRRLLQRVLRKPDVDQCERLLAPSLGLFDLTLLSEGALPRLRIVSLSGNAISTLRWFCACPALEELILRKNQVAELEEIGFLVGLARLSKLWLAENPIASLPRYSDLVRVLLPQVLQLDQASVETAPTAVPAIADAQLLALADAARRRGASAAAAAAAAAVDDDIAVAEPPLPPPPPSAVEQAVLLLLSQLDQPALARVRDACSSRIVG